MSLWCVCDNRCTAITSVATQHSALWSVRYTACWHDSEKDESWDINHWLKASSRNWREQRAVNSLDWRLNLCLVSSQCSKLSAQSFSCRLQLSTQPDSYNTWTSSTTLNTGYTSSPTKQNWYLAKIPECKNTCVLCCTALWAPVAYDLGTHSTSQTYTADRLILVASTVFSSVFTDI